MKAILYDGSRRVPVDTTRDICLLSGPHTSPRSGTVQVYRKDLYLHRIRNTGRQFYLHLRHAGKTGKDKVVPVSPVMAERYLLSRGITCNEFPSGEPVSRLYNWGYGIAEEF